MTGGLGTPHHAAHKITMMRASVAARLAMMMTKRRISRCSVVIDVGATEDSLAMRPLWVARETTQTSVRGRSEDAQDSVISDLEDET